MLDDIGNSILAKPRIRVEVSRLMRVFTGGRGSILSNFLLANQREWRDTRDTKNLNDIQKELLIKA